MGFQGPWRKIATSCSLVLHSAKRFTNLASGLPNLNQKLWLADVSEFPTPLVLEVQRFSFGQG